MGPFNYSSLLVLFFSVCVVFSHNETLKSSRQKRLFSLFNIVTFANEACTTTVTGNLIGTCFTSTECTAKGGSASGNCASGFGVCCLFSVSGACTAAQTVGQNCTYIRNNGFPSADTTVNQICTYNFNRISNNLCQIRLDFDTLVSQNGNTGVCGGANDAITVSSPFATSLNAFPPTVCGTLTGQHMYFETGMSGATAGSLMIAKGSGTGNRIFQIKATYLTCDNLAKAPEGCTQYFTGLSGNFQSYNFRGGQLLASMNYNNCFRQEEGYCQIEVREATGATPDPFAVSPVLTMAMVLAPDIGVRVDFLRVFINNVIDCAGALARITFATPTSGTFCGGILSQVAMDVVPGILTSSPGTSFQLGLISSAALTAGLTGFNLNFNQVPCA